MRLAWLAWLGGVVLALGLSLGVGVRAARADDEVTDQTLEDHECLSCHGFAKNEEKAPFVDGRLFLVSVHKDVACTDCHGDYEGNHPQKMAPPESCASCHSDEYDQVKKSVHGVRFPGPEAPETSPACGACHGIHDVFKPTDRRSHLFPLEVPFTCGRCHANEKDGTPTPASERPTVDQLLSTLYADDTHGAALLKAGLVTAPTCVTCHGKHDIRHPEDPAASVNRMNVSKTCGQCHVGIYEHYVESIHGTTPRGHPENNANKREPATCTDCHTPHGIERVGLHFKLKIIQTCSRCHGERGRTYKGTYHGHISEIGLGGVAACSDCHTAHDILPSSDPRSSVNPAHRTATCAKCHEGATPRFASYLVHANPDDPKRFPILYYARTIMRDLILGTWALWGLHTLLWLFRAWKDRKRIRAHIEPVSGRWYRRWPWSYRAIHLTLIFSFLLLAMTGIPLRFSEAPWARTVFDFLGGAANCRLLHRIGAALTFAYALAFVVMIAVRLARGERGIFRGPSSLLPRVKDLHDIRANLKWFVKGGHPPAFDRWTYYEKFDFLAEVWGVMFIGITGLVMWFPIFFTDFLPGWGINLANIFHSYEALLATTFIFTVHFFNANLRPGKFPVDPMFLHGRISEEELRHERPAEYERMRAEGRLESEALPPPNERVTERAHIMGILLMSIGLVLVLLMASTLL